MRNHLLPFILSFFTFFSFGQYGFAQWHISATGTGQTTGHIADLTITNQGDEARIFDFDNYLIPSDGKYQG